MVLDGKRQETSSLRSLFFCEPSTLLRRSQFPRRRHPRAESLLPRVGESFSDQKVFSHGTVFFFFFPLSLFLDAWCGSSSFPDDFFAFYGERRERAVFFLACETLGLRDASSFPSTTRASPPLDRRLTPPLSVPFLAPSPPEENRIPPEHFFWRLSPLSERVLVRRRGLFFPPSHSDDHPFSKGEREWFFSS